jgi:hypothetical protein
MQVLQYDTIMTWEQGVLKYYTAQLLDAQWLLCLSPLLRVKGVKLYLCLIKFHDIKYGRNGGIVQPFQILPLERVSGQLQAPVAITPGIH